MLQGAVTNLIEQGHSVSVLSRGRLKLQNKDIAHFQVRWDDEESLEAAMDCAIVDYGLPADVICWAHRFEYGLSFARLIKARTRQFRFFHVLGSAAHDPTDPDRLKGFKAQMAGIDWRPIILGFVREGAHSRWLEHKEISSGVIAAMAEDKTLHVIGETRPWKDRP